jgi:hypothetical protein
MKLLIAVAFLFICPNAAFPGSWDIFFKKNLEQPTQQINIPGFDQAAPATAVADQTWLSAQADTLLAIIKVLYKGDDDTVKQLEAAQAGLDPVDKVARRISFIQSTVEQQAKKATK